MIPWKIIGGAAPAGVQDGDTPQVANGKVAWTPGDGPNNDGLIGCTLADLALIATANTDFPVLSGKLITYTCRAKAPASRIAFEVDTPGTEMTANENGIGIYDTAGNLIMQTEDLSAAWGGGGDHDVQVVDLPDEIDPGLYYLGVLINYAGDSPYLAGAPCPIIPEIGTTFLSPPRVAYSNGTYTALPEAIDWQTDGFTTNFWNFVTFLGLLP
jgi:hypothetical protein